MQSHAFRRSLLCLVWLPALAGADFPIEPAQRIPLPGVQGRIDHLAVDLKGNRLFVAALGNHSLEVLDLAAGKRIHAISGLAEPQGVAYLAGAGRIVAASGGDGSCRFFDGRSYQETAKLDCGDDADNVRYDPRAGRVYVGYGRGGLAVVDPAQPKRIADIPLAGHPESFQLESAGDRIFVNVPAARQIAVVSRASNSVIATWPLGESQANFPMALDEAGQRLFVGCRKPASLLVLDAASGKRAALLACSGDTDDLFYDRPRKRVYVTGGEGTITVFQQETPDRYRLTATVKTAPGARTSLYVPETSSLYLAVPARENREAAIWVYRLGGP